MKNESNLQNAKDYARIVYSDDVKFFPYFSFPRESFENLAELIGVSAPVARS